MIWNLFGVFIIGLCSGAFGYLIIKISKGRAPKWLIPICAGAGMFSYLAYYDYTWYEFKSGQMPKESVVVQEYRESDFFRPWSYIYPSINQFDVFDGQFTVKNQDGETIAEYMIYQFIKDPTEKMDIYAHVLNCNTLERVVMNTKKPQATQTIEKVPANDALLSKVCN